MRARVRAIASEGGREGGRKGGTEGRREGGREAGRQAGRQAGRERRVDWGGVEYRSGWRSARRFAALPSLLLPR
jgi:hypothetical protein